MDTLLDRINSLKSLKGLSVRAFANLIGCNQVTIDRQLKGERSISIETLTAVLQTYPDISAEWLMRGKGGMYQEGQSINISMNKVGNVGTGASVAAGTGASSSINGEQSNLIEENARLREENRQLRERCDKLTDKLLSL